MHVDYEVSEKDFLEAQKLAIRSHLFRASPVDTLWCMPLIGFNDSGSFSSMLWQRRDLRSI